MAKFGLIRVILSKKCGSCTVYHCFILKLSGRATYTPLKPTLADNDSFASAAALTVDADDTCSVDSMKSASSDFEVGSRRKVQE